MAINVCLVGADGKMGREISNLIEGDDDFGQLFKVDPELEDNEDCLEFRDFDLVDPDKVMVVINFTNPEATLESARWCAANEVSLVTGTTGLSIQQTVELEALSDEVAIVYAPNMSLGVNLIDALLPRFARVLQGFAIEIVEVHHDKKKDSPSGTAVRFANTLAGFIGGEVVFGRAKGLAENRPVNEVNVHALRGGTVPGEHTIYFLGPDEVIEIKHSALSRKIFAKGAVLAAKWIVGKPAGFYSMKDVLGL